jgi:uncharacterized protein
MRITIKVRPGSTHPGVGGNLDGALVVRVAPRATDGKATEAALAAVATAFGLRRDAVSLVTGATSRTKIIQLTGADPAVLQQLLSPQDPPNPPNPPNPQDPPNPPNPSA